MTYWGLPSTFFRVQKKKKERERWHVFKRGSGTGVRHKKIAPKIVLETKLYLKNEANKEITMGTEAASAGTPMQMCTFATITINYSGELGSQTVWTS